MPRHAFGYFAKALNFLISAFFIGLLGITLFRPDLFAALIAWIEQGVKHIGNWNYLVIFTSSIIESFPAIGMLVPGQQVMLLVGGFFGRDHLPWVLILASAGAVIGNWVGYYLGKRYGDSFIHHYGDAFGIGKTEKRILESQIAKNGPVFVMFGKFHNFTRSFIPFIAGSSNMHPKKFWLYNIVGSILWACTMMVLGIFFTTYLDVILDYLSYAILGLIWAVILYIVTFKRKEFQSYMEEKTAELNNKHR